MTCAKSPDGTHRCPWSGDRCWDCKTQVPTLRESREQPQRAEIRAKAGAGAYGMTAETRAIDVARRRAGDHE